MLAAGNHSCELASKIFTLEQGDLVIMEEVGDGTSSQDVESVASSGERGEVLSVVSSEQPIRSQDW